MGILEPPQPSTKPPSSCEREGRCWSRTESNRRLETAFGDFAGGPTVKTPSFQCMAEGWGVSSIPAQGTKIPCALGCSQKVKKKKDCIRTRTEPRMLDPKSEHRYMSGNIMDTAQNPYILGYCAVLCLVAQLCLFATPWTVAHQVPLSIGILQARILEWVAVSSSRGSSQPRSPVLQTDSLPTEPPGKPKNTGGVAYPFSS